MRFAGRADDKAAPLGGVVGSRAAARATDHHRPARQQSKFLQKVHKSSQRGIEPRSTALREQQLPLAICIVTGGDTNHYTIANGWIQKRWIIAT